MGKGEAQRRVRQKKKKKGGLRKDYAAMIANNQQLIHCEALSHRYLSLHIRGLTSTFAADEGASSLLNSNGRKSDGDSTPILDLAHTCG